MFPFYGLEWTFSWGVLYIQDIGHEPCILDEGLARGKKLKIIFA